MFDCNVLVLSHHGAEPARTRKWLGILPPRAAARIFVNDVELDEGLLSYPQSNCVFTDARGRPWLRTGEGILKESQRTPTTACVDGQPHANPTSAHVRCRPLTYGNRPDRA